MFFPLALSIKLVNSDLKFNNTCHLVRKYLILVGQMDSNLVMIDLIFRTPNDHSDVTHAYNDQPTSVPFCIL